MPENATSTRAAYVMIGGFLGAGKTTAVWRLAQHLHGRGLRVGLITNDQSAGLVDTALLQAKGFPVQEITGGCFCCKFNSLVEASEVLSRETRPDVFIAEPVGSCTDLLATVSYPLRRIYGGHFRVAPLSVLVDPLRAMRILGLASGRAFSEKVLYVYDRQLDEAEFIVINKTDLVETSQLAELQAALHRRYPKARQFTVSALNDAGLEPWFGSLADADASHSPASEVDYDLYAEGEALLGWLNCTLGLSSARAFDGNALLAELAARIQTGLAGQGFEVAHLKMTLNPEEEGGDIGVCNLVRGDGRPEQYHRLGEPLAAGELILNLRAEGDPEQLRATAMNALEACLLAAGVRMELQHTEHFRPARPVPVHRMASL